MFHQSPKARAPSQDSARQGGSRGASKSTPVASLRTELKACSTQMSGPASGDGRSSCEKNPTPVHYTGWARNSPPSDRQWYTRE